MSGGKNTGDHPGRKVHRERFDKSVVDVKGTPTRREFVSRYDAEGNFVSQGYTDRGEASKNETSSGTWR